MLTVKKNSASEYYDKYFECYNYWSGEEGGGYHFGIANGIGDILDNDKMVKNASELVFSALNLDFSKPLRVLDAGCGSGHVSRFLAEKFFNKDILVYGVTVSKKQLEYAKKINTKKGLENKIIFSLDDFEKLPFEDNFFDAIFFQDSICYGEGPKKELAIREAARVLKLGGTLAIADGFINPKRGDFFIKKINKILCNSFGVKGWAENMLFSEELKKAGFINIHLKDLTWLIGPSVMQTLYFKLPRVFWAYLTKKLNLKDLKLTFRVAIFAPILGLHPYFKYQLISVTKGRTAIKDCLSEKPEQI